MADDHFDNANPLVSTYNAPTIQAEIVNPNLKKVDPKTATWHEIQ